MTVSLALFQPFHNTRNTADSSLKTVFASAKLKFGSSPHDTPPPKPEPQGAEPATGEHCVVDIKSYLQAVLDKRNILGFVPTPAHVVQKLVEWAQIVKGVTALEASAGKGNIAEALKEAGADVSVIEQDPILQKILKLKGFTLVGEDFLSTTGQYARIVMNPPFEGRRDIQHFLHAYQQLKPGRKVVAILSENAFVAKPTDSSYYQELIGNFTGWLKDLQADVLPLPQNTFLSTERPTTVDTRVIVLTKPVTHPSENSQKNGYQKVCDTFARYWAYWHPIEQKNNIYGNGGILPQAAPDFKNPDIVDKDIVA